MESVENRLAGIKAGLPKAEFGPASPERFIAQYPPGPYDQMQTRMRIYRIYKAETTFPRCNIKNKRGKLALPRSDDVDARFAFGDLADHGNVREALLQEQRQDFGDRIRGTSDEQAA